MDLADFRAVPGLLRVCAAKLKHLFCGRPLPDDEATFPGETPFRFQANERKYCDINALSYE